MITALDHTQVAMPAGGDRDARGFYSDLLAWKNWRNPPRSPRGGARFALPDGRRLHLGAEDPFRPSRKAHPAFVASSLDELAQRIEAGGLTVRGGTRSWRRGGGSTGRTLSGTGWSSWSRSGLGGDIMVGVGIRPGGRG